eukprot:1506627-Alexandrium_andersonii.AAC.1
MLLHAKGAPGARSPLPPQQAVHLLFGHLRVGFLPTLPPCARFAARRPFPCGGARPRGSGIEAQTRARPQNS